MKMPPKFIFVIAAVFLAVLVLVLANSNADSESPRDARTEEAIAETPSEKPVEKPTSSPADAEALWLQLHGIASPADFLSKEGYDFYAPLHSIQPGWGGSVDGYLEITVQEPLNDEQTKRLGINVLNFIGPDFPDITGVIFIDSQGIEHNFFRRDAPLAIG